jgi:hypothetical protein
LPPNEASHLEADLLRAHREGDVPAIVTTYMAIADACEGREEVDAACFYLTQAYVWALEAGMPDAAALHARLKARGREE